MHHISSHSWVNIYSGSFGDAEQVRKQIRQEREPIYISKAVLAAIVLLLAALPAPVRLRAQTLARPGWVGSGLATQIWFKHGIFYQIDTRTFASSKPDSSVGDLKGITQRLDYIHSLGADAILLKPLTPAAGGQANAIDPALGTLDDLDDLTLQSSRLKVRIVLELPTPDPALARFWLTRGIAGFYIPGNAANAPGIETIRKLLPTYVGQRILITDADLTPVSTALKSNDLLLERAVWRPVQIQSPAFALPSINRRRSSKWESHFWR